MFGQLADITAAFVEEPAEQTRRRLAPLVEAINSLEPTVSKLSLEELKATSGQLRQRARQGEALDELLPEAFALVREASKRVLGLRHFDVQLMGGIVLHQGGVAEMATGEGKTLVAILAAFLNALAGQGVHVVTTNDYLARRDAAWVGRPLRLLGLSVGVIQAEMEPEEKRAAYACDVTYVTNQQLGFDYLRDQMACRPSDLRLRSEEPFSCAIVDEADSVLIDEGRTPLVVSTQSTIPSEKYTTALQVASQLAKLTDYTVLEKEKTCVLTEVGELKVSAALGKDDLFDPQDPWAPFIVNSLTAKELYQRDRQYLVRDGQVVVVDEFTGRPVEGRSWSDGLQQAIEAKEGVEIQPEAVVLASISYQCLFRLFKKLSGMTGTASTEAQELESIYSLTVSPVPSNKPCQRLDEEDEVYTTEGGKWRAVTAAACEAHSLGRPVLVGTTSVENSEVLAGYLSREGLTYKLLNAKPENAAREAEIVAAGGLPGAITIATNMAGRGTDIVLGGDGKAMAKLYLKEALRNVSSTATPDENSPELSELCLPLSDAIQEELTSACFLVASAAPSLAAADIERALAGEALAEASDAVLAAVQSLKATYHKAQDYLLEACELQSREVVEAGGLCVLGTERHEARRIDNQLRGRSGRQGDPGSSRFFLSLTDKVFRVFGGDTIRMLTADMGGADDVPMVSPLVSGAIDEAQNQVQSFFFGIRKDVFKYDEVLDQQRQVVYGVRRKALLDSDEGVLDSLRSYCTESMTELVEQLISPSQPLDSWPLERMATKLSAWFTGTLSVTPEELRAVAGAGGEEGSEALRCWVQRETLEAIDRKAARIDEDAPQLHRAVFRQVLLMQIDNYWRKHLKYMTFLRNYSKLRSYGQRDPLVEYKLDGYKAFQVMMGKIRRDTVYYLFTFQPRPLRPIPAERFADKSPPETDAGLLQQVLALLDVTGPLLPLSDGRLADLLEQGGLKNPEERLHWLHSADGVETMEDAFARAVYLSKADVA